MTLRVFWMILRCIMMKFVGLPPSMKLTCKLLTVIILSLTGLTLAQGQDLYLIIGQSNAAGRGDLPANPTALTGVQVLQGNSNFVPALPNLNVHSTVRNTNKDVGFNLGYSFSQSMRAANNRNIQLVVNARGATSIAHWFPGVLDKAAPLTYFDEAIRRVQAARAANPNAILRGILWHQGESNRNRSRYMDEIVTLIGLLRDELGNVPFVAGQLSYARDDNETFNTNLLQLPNLVPNTAVVTAEGLVTSDRTHFTASAIQTLGQRYAVQMRALQAGNPSGPEPIAHWAMNEGSGNSVRDVSGNGHDAVLTGANWNRNGAIGSALSFESNSGGLSLPVSAFTGLNAEVTIAVWANGSLNQPLNNINFRALMGSNRTLNIHLPWSNSNVYWDAGNTGRVYDRINRSANASLYEGGWNHWVFTKNTSTGRMNIYVNGELFHTGTGKSLNMSGITSAVLGSNYNGSMDEMMLFNSELSAQEVRDLYTPPLIEVINVALGKPATQSSTVFGGSASRAVDGDTNGDWRVGSTTHTAISNRPSWQVDLGSSHEIQEIDIFNRTDYCSERLSNFTVSVIDSQGRTTFSRSFADTPNPSITIDTGGVNGRTVRVQLNGSNHLSLAEVAVYGERN